MNITVISHKPCWVRVRDANGYVTDGGFPFQMRALSELFDSMELVVPVDDTLAPPGTTPLTGRNLTVTPLTMPAGHNLRRKLSLLAWAPTNLSRIWRAVRNADAIHAPIPGDIGTLGIIAALIQNKPLFVRYCGVWGEPKTLAQHFWFYLLIGIAGGKRVVLATGGDRSLPTEENRHIQWIFSTSLSEKMLREIPLPETWRQGCPLRLITVGRQEPGKNTDLVIKALPLIRRSYPLVSLDIVGDGSALPELKRLVQELELTDAVIFHGYVDHDTVIEKLQQATLFCFPTESEGFPKAVHEALACGLPVITTPVSVLKQLIGEHNGHLLSSTEPAAIADAVLTIVADDKQFNAKAIAAQETASEFSLERWRDEIGQHLRGAWGTLRSDG